LYLEKDALSGGFKENEGKVLDVLLGQAIVSIENAKLYKDLSFEKEQKKVVRRVADTQKHLIKNISAELALVEERERRNIADDLHDSVTQNLALSVLDLKKMGGGLEPGQKKTKFILKSKRFTQNKVK
jgi:signal transduction histidine kinase